MFPDSPARAEPRRSDACTPTRLDLPIAALVGGAAGSVYIATMFPGLAAIGDTPKFQFVGSVLGTPHSPGYPVYMLLSWAFAQLPIGTLAYRINLLSAVFGGIAVALLYLVARELGCRRLIAAAGALGIGFGHVFWSQAILAEVYTVNAAFFGGALFFLLRWSRSRRDRDLIAAVAFVALGAAHHLTLVMTVPALTIFALLVDARRTLSPKVVWSTVGLACASLSAYGYIWLRTTQGAPFLEVQAHSLGELVKIVRADTFDAFLGQLSLATIVRERMPFIAGWLGGELRAVGLALLVPGVAVLASRRRREGVLFAVATLAIVGFALDYVVYDVEVFLLIPMILLGLTAAVGLEAIAAAADRVPNRLVRAAAVGALAVVVAVGQFRANRVDNDQHRHVYENTLFDALFRELPDKSAIVQENYPIDSMLLYKLIGEHAAGKRTVVVIPAEPAAVAHYLGAGYQVFAFHEHRRELQARGVQFVDAPLRLPTSPSLAHVLDTECLTMGYPLGQAVEVVGDSDQETAEPERFNPAVRVRR